ncbi:MAG: alpha/beta fold hydrolase [Anaerolineales bacterium]|nr:alpha/beta fold hydrolase [Anaerolineales bacterium]
MTQPDDAALTQAAQRAWDRFRTPAGRETTSKNTRVLSTATLMRADHRQLLQWPPEADAPAIALQAYIWPGPAQDSPTVLLAHGWEWQAGRWEAFIAPLQAAGWRVVAYDAPAHGRSEGAMSTLIDYAAAIRSVAEAVGGVRALVGHSFGGMAALWLLAQGHGVERPLNGVERVVSISAANDVEFLLHGYGQFADGGEALRQAFREEFRRRIGGYPIEFNAAKAGARLTQPVLIVHDQRDLVVPHAQAEVFATHLPQAEILSTAGLGHRLILRDAAVVRRAVDFLAPALGG